MVNIYENGALIHTGTSWEGYYRYDPESGPTTPPAISTLLFREAGSANSADLGKGYLIDNMSMSSSTLACMPTGLMRDRINLTAALVSPARRSRGRSTRPAATSASTTPPAQAEVLAARTSQALTTTASLQRGEGRRDQ